MTQSATNLGYGAGAGTDVNFHDGRYAVRVSCDYIRTALFGGRSEQCAHFHRSGASLRRAGERKSFLLGVCRKPVIRAGQCVWPGAHRPPAISATILLMSLILEIDAERGEARAGRMTLAHGEVLTPVFMPVGTPATVKGVPQDVLEELQVEILLGNTYHLYLRPGRGAGAATGRAASLHGMGPRRPDRFGRLSGVQSGVLAQPDRRRRAVSLAPGRLAAFSVAGRVHRVQIALGADIIMAFDECTEYPAERGARAGSMELTLRWANDVETIFRPQLARGAGGCRGQSGNRRRATSSCAVRHRARGHVSRICARECARAAGGHGFPRLRHRRSERGGAARADL